MFAAHIAACSFDAWYPRFRDVTFRSVVLPLPPGLADFLVQDGVFLPSTSAALPLRSKPDEYAVEGVDYTDWTSEDEGEDVATGVEQFQRFRGEVDAAIAQLGGKVLPKLNWSAPKDAAWVTATNTIACTNADEVLLLLQSSDRVAHDICHAFDSCADAPATASGRVETDAAASAEPSSAAGGPQAGGAAAPQQHDGQQEAAAGQQEAAPVAGSSSGSGQGNQWPQHVLVLRAWWEMRPGREFRCFVRGREIVGISQRDVTQRFDFLASEQDELKGALLEFHEDHVMAAFPLQDYTYDVYVTSHGAVRLIDFNPVGGSTAPLLFEDWAQLGYGFAAAERTSGGTGQAAAAPAAAADAGFSAGANERCAAAEAAMAAVTDASATGHSGGGGGGGGGGASGAAAAEADVVAAHLACASLTEQAAAAAAARSSSPGAGASHHANGSSQQNGSSAHNGSSALNGSSQQNGSSALNGSSVHSLGSSLPQLPDVDFRFIDEPVVMRSAAQGYGVPYDFVDSSVTGALADFVAQQRAAGS